MHSNTSLTARDEPVTFVPEQAGESCAPRRCLTHDEPPMLGVMTPEQAQAGVELARLTSNSQPYRTSLLFMPSSIVLYL